jgi:hypothetical protein
MDVYRTTVVCVSRSRNLVELESGPQFDAALALTAANC